MWLLLELIERIFWYVLALKTFEWIYVRLHYNYVHAHTHSYSLSHGFWQSLLMMTIFINDKIWKKNEKNWSAINLDYTWNEMETSVHLHTSTLMSHNGQCNSWSRHCSIAFLTVVHSSLAHSTLFGVVLIKCNHETFNDSTI